MTPPATAAERVQHPAGVGGQVGFDGDGVVLVAQRGRAELGDAGDVAGELPLPIRRCDAQFGVEDGHPQATADREHRVACGFDGEHFAHLRELFGHLGGQVAGL